MATYETAIDETISVDNDESATEDSYVRADIAENSNTPASILEQLADDDDWYVRSVVAHNKNTPAATLEKLADDDNKTVLIMITNNSNAPASVLEKLADDPSMQFFVAGNPNTPAAMLEKLAGDSDGWGESIESRQVAKNPSAPASALDRLADSDDLNLQEEALQNPSISVATLERFATGMRWQREAVAQNESTPASVLEQLADDDDWHVRCAVAGNPSTPVDVLVRLASRK